MSQAETFERVKKVVADQLGVEADTIRPQSTFIDDLGADSLDIVELVPDEAAEKILSVQEAVDYINSKAAASA